MVRIPGIGTGGALGGFVKLLCRTQAGGQQQEFPGIGTGPGEGLVIPVFYLADASAIADEQLMSTPTASQSKFTRKQIVLFIYFTPEY
jgi:hypothetical protein